jgi:peptide deformylase
MNTLKVLIYPDKGLLTPAAPIETIDDHVRSMAAQMIATMYAEEGIGLAATQVGIRLRMLTIDLSEEKNQPQVLINPVIKHRSGTIPSNEGCLSFPGLRIDIKRSEKITITATDLEGNPVNITAEGLLSRCLQHEIDHLDGIVFIDHLSWLKRSRTEKKFLKELREYH